MNELTGQKDMVVDTLQKTLDAFKNDGSGGPADHE